MTEQTWMINGVIINLTDSDNDRSTDKKKR